MSFDTRTIFIRVSSKHKARAEAMRVKRESQVESKRRAAEEKASWIEAERKADASKA